MEAEITFVPQGFYCPITGELMTWHADLPEDFVKLVEVLQQDTKLNAKEEY